MIVTIYEPGYCGIYYPEIGNGDYFVDRETALTKAREEEGESGIVIEHKAILLATGEYYLLQHDSPLKIQ